MRLREMKKGGYKVRAFDLKVKAVNDDGTFTGYGSVFGVLDSYNEIVAPGAFTESLKEIADSGRALPALWQHRSDSPIGIYTELAEDETGLLVKGTLAREDVVQAREAFALMKLGAVTGLSIGYYVRESSFDEKTGIRTLKKLDLVEVSIVTFPANDAARIDMIKAKLAHGGLPTLPEFENFLREAGFSKTRAAVIASRGLAHLLQSESASAQGDPETAGLLSQMAEPFKL
jgi:HK97 family phage prohead protease